MRAEKRRWQTSAIAPTRKRGCDQQALPDDNKDKV